MITSTQNEQIKFLTKLKQKKYRDQYRQYLISGEHLIQEALAKNVVELIIYSRDNKLINLASNLYVSQNVLDKISDVESSSIVALCNYNEFKDYSDSRIVVLDGLQDPGNAGTIIRNALAFNYDLVFFSNDSVDMYNSKFIRATQGYFYHLPIIRGDLNEFINKYLNNNYDVIVTCLENDSVSLTKLKKVNNHLLIIGNEGQGASKEVIKLATHKVKIEMNDKVDSLNAGVAAGIVMHYLLNFKE